MIFKKIIYYAQNKIDSGVKTWTECHIKLDPRTWYALDLWRLIVVKSSQWWLTISTKIWIWKIKINLETTLPQNWQGCIKNTWNFRLKSSSSIKFWKLIHEEHYQLGIQRQRAKGSGFCDYEYDNPPGNEKMLKQNHQASLQEQQKLYQQM